MLLISLVYPQIFRKICVRVTFSFHFYKFCCVCMNRADVFGGTVRSTDSKNGKRLKVNMVKKDCNYFRFLTDIFQFVHFINEDSFFFFSWKVQSNFEQVSEKISHRNSFHCSVIKISQLQQLTSRDLCSVCEKPQYSFIICFFKSSSFQSGTIVFASVKQEKHLRSCQHSCQQYLHTD